MEITVKNNNLRVSPRKVRPVLYNIKGQTAESALDLMRFTHKKAAGFLVDLIKSGIAAAKDHEMEIEHTFVKSVVCNEGQRLKRRRFESKGRATKITKRTAHIVLTLSDENIVSKKHTNNKSERMTNNKE